MLKRPGEELITVKPDQDELLVYPAEDEVQVETGNTSSASQVCRVMAPDQPDLSSI